MKKEGLAGCFCFKEGLKKRGDKWYVPLCGFTLIELLVVVLIVAILAAVAVPQYQRAVKKSQLAAVIPLVKATMNAEKVYYLQNGVYADFRDIAALDLDFPNCSIDNSWGTFKCQTFIIDVSTGFAPQKSQGTMDIVGFLLDKNAGPGTLAYREIDDGRTYCIASKADIIAQNVCNSMGGTNRTSQTVSYHDRIQSPVYVYALK